jgi:hypothetical protein
VYVYEWEMVSEEDLAHSREKAYGHKGISWRDMAPKLGMVAITNRWKKQGRAPLPPRAFFFNSFIHMCINCLGHFSPLTPAFPLSPYLQAETVLPSSLILLMRRHKHNKEDKAFLLVE